MSYCYIIVGNSVEVHARVLQLSLKIVYSMNIILQLNDLKFNDNKQLY